MPAPRSAQPHSRLLPNLTDTLIDHGRIHLLSIIGAGTYGVVYRALDAESDTLQPRYFAVKCQLKAAEPRMKLHQQREIRLHKMVSGHPGVVSLHRVVTERGFLFLVLDWCQDGDLFTVLTERNPFVGNDPVTKSAFLQLIDSVEYIHKMGVIHRDLKPENILCSGSQLLLTDFGLATADVMGREFECGSSYYMSPECVGDLFGRAEPFIYAPGDVWALGIMLINMSCARNPWGNASLADQCFRMFLRDPLFLRHKLPITGQMHDVLQRIFVLDPHLRITLPQLRIAVVALEALTLSREQLFEASAAVRAAAQAARRHCIPPVHKKPVPMIVHAQGDVGGGGGSDGARHSGLNSLEQALAEALGEVEQRAHVSKQANAGSPRSLFRRRARRSIASGSTAPSTPGPVTPEMHACDAAQVAANVDEDVLNINDPAGWAHAARPAMQQGASLVRSNAIKKKKRSLLPHGTWKKLRKLVG